MGGRLTSVPPTIVQTLVPSGARPGHLEVKDQIKMTSDKLPFLPEILDAARAFCSQLK